MKPHPRPSLRKPMKTSAAEEIEWIYDIRPECKDEVPKTRFKPKAGKTLSAKKWKTSFSEDGRLDIAKSLKRIQRGGIHPLIKGEVWEFLLGCYDPNSTYLQRNELRQMRREQYASWKAECQKMVPLIGKGRIITAPLVMEEAQASQDSSSNESSKTSSRTTCLQPQDADSSKKVIQWKKIVFQIGLDVVRTDQALCFYESEINQAKLWDILSVYAWVDEDIGYCQGMSDICSPMVILFDDEADAFWCFERAMRKLRENFRCSTSSIGVQSQLNALSEIIQAIDPKLHQLIEELDGGQYLFAFRMLMVLFRREFSFVDSLYLWELMWAMEYNPNLFSSYERPRTATDKSIAAKMNDKMLKQCGKFERENVITGHNDSATALSIFLVASVLETKNKRLLKEAQGMDDVVKILGDITGNLDAKKACNEALKIQKKYLKMKKM